MSSIATKVVLVLALYLTAVQASAISRNGVVESKDTVDVTKNGITIKRGYEGYLHTGPQTAVAESRKDNWFSASTIDAYKAALMYHAGFLPVIGLKIAKVILHFAIALFVGLGATTALCSFTPLCNITYNVNKPSFLSGKKEMLPALKEAIEVVSRIPNIFKAQTSEPVQPEEAESVLEELPNQELDVDARNSQKNVVAESRNAKSLELDAKENEA